MIKKVCVVVALTACLAFGLAPSTGAASVQATIIQTNGNVSGQKAAGEKSVPLVKGDTLFEGAVIKTGAGQTMMLNPVPGIAVWLSEKSTLSIEKLDFNKNGEEISSRDVILRLESGSLSFGIEKLNPKVTHFIVKTSKGDSTAKGTSGTIGVTSSGLNVSTTSGTISSGCGDAPVDLPPGAVMKSSGTEVTVTNLATGKLSSYQNCVFTGERDATVAELTAASNIFSAALAEATPFVLAAVENGVLSQASLDAIAATITQVNSTLAANNLPAIGGVGATGDTTTTATATATGGGTGGGTNVSTGGGSSGGFTVPIGTSFSFGGGVTAINPANTSGQVSSPER